MNDRIMQLAFVLAGTSKTLVEIEIMKIHLKHIRFEVLRQQIKAAQSTDRPRKVLEGEVVRSGAASKPPRISNLSLA